MRELVSGRHIQAEVQALVDADPRIDQDRTPIIVPMPKPQATESMTGCNWTIHYRGQFGDCERFVDEAVEIVQNACNIAGPSALAGAPV